MSLFQNPDQIFFDKFGNRAALGRIYFGRAGENPKDAPKAPFSDPDLSSELDTNIQLTTAGKLPQRVYLDGSYSVLVEKSNGEQIFLDLRFGRLESKTFNTVSEMKLSGDLVLGGTARTLGYYEAGDGGGATYIISPNQAVDGYGDHLLASGNVALLQVDGTLKSTQYGVGNSDAAFEGFLSRLGSQVSQGNLLSDVSTSSTMQVETSIDLKGGRKDKGDKPTIAPATGMSGVKVTKAFVGGVDENIVSVTLDDFKVIEQTESKTAGTSGVLFDRVNKEGRLKQVEVRGFEKGIELKGVIGGVLDNVFCTNNKYGLYTLSNNDAGLPSYDCTNTVLLHGAFNANEYGVYLGDLTQGLAFNGTNIERNTSVGLVMANTPPASSAIGFYGAWFEGNPIAVQQVRKIDTAKFDGCYFFDNTELWDNAGSAFVLGEWNRCKIDSSHINLDIFRGRFVNNDVTNCTFTATSPEAYQCEEWSGTPVSVDDGNTLLSTKAMGNGCYDVVAIGSPGTTNLIDGSRWHEVLTGNSYIKIAGSWTLIRSELIHERTQDFGSIAAGSSLPFGPITVSGVTVGDFVSVSSDGDMQGVIFQAYVSASNQVSGTLYNLSGSAVDLPSMSYKFLIQKN